MQNGKLPQASQERLQLLIVEDEPLVLMDLALTVEDCGADALQATTAKRALAIIDGQRVDAAILDVNLGRGETCADVAKVLKDRNIPFVIHSGDLDRQGELIRVLDAPIYAKPSLTNDVVLGAIDLVGECEA